MDILCIFEIIFYRKMWNLERFTMKKFICFGAAALMALAATGCKSGEDGEAGGSLTVGGKSYNYDHAVAFISGSDTEGYEVGLYLSNFEIKDESDLDVPEGAQYDVCTIYYANDVPDVSTCSIRPYPVFEQNPSIELPVWMLIAAVGATGTSEPQNPDLRYSYTSERIFMEETPENVEAIANEPDLNITKDGETYRIEAKDMLLCDEDTNEIVKVSFNYSGPMTIIVDDDVKLPE